MIGRRKLMAAFGAAAISPFAAFAQPQSSRVYRIGFLSPAITASYAEPVAALRKSLRELGYIEGKNVLYEERWADNNVDRLPQLAAELVRLQCDVVVANGTAATRALKGATTTIPIVMATSGDAVRAGLVSSLARPGGNVTGLTFVAPELYVKRVELISELAPRTRLLAYLLNPNNPGLQENVAELKEAATRSKMTARAFTIRSVNEFETAF